MKRKIGSPPLYARADSGLTHRLEPMLTGALPLHQVDVTAVFAPKMRSQRR